MPMEMDEMELERYITGMLDTEHRNMKKNLRADKHKHKQNDDPQRGDSNGKGKQSVK